MAAKDTAASEIPETSHEADKKTSEDEKKLLAKLKSLLSADPYLSEKNIDDDFAVKFLRVRCHDVDAAFTLIKGYFNMRKDHPELFKLPSEVVDVLQDKVFSISPKTNSTGELIMIFRPGLWDTTKYDAYHIAAAPVPFLEAAALDPRIQEAGMLEVLDFADVTWRQFTSMPASLHKLSADLSERAIPIKYKKIHIVNQGRLIDMLWAIMKPFVSDEMKQKLCFHGEDFSGLKNEIDESLLPPELGGTREDKHLTDPNFIPDLDAKIKALWDKYQP